MYQSIENALVCREHHPCPACRGDLPRALNARPPGGRATEAARPPAGRPRRGGRTPELPTPRRRRQSHLRGFFPRPLAFEPAASEELSLASADASDAPATRQTSSFTGFAPPLPPRLPLPFVQLAAGSVTEVGDPLGELFADK